jgi:hypothetical protein
MYITNGTVIRTSISTGDEESAAGAGLGDSFKRGRIKNFSELMPSNSQQWTLSHLGEGMHFKPSKEILR